MKTAATVLQEMMVKHLTAPEYECITQNGPQHLAMFEYRCTALGCYATAAAHSKKEARQVAARRLLLQLAGRGLPVPPPYNMPESGDGAGAAAGASAEEAARNSVVLLRELCEDYHLPAATYDLVSDTGPPHMRLFAVRARVGAHERLASASSKKAARQLAARQLYCYLRDNLARLTADFTEDEALVRAHERAMERYVELREDWRPDLGQRVADYQRGLHEHIDAEKLAAAREVLVGAEAGAAADAAEAAAAALGLRAEWSALPPLLVLTLAPASPALVFAGVTREAAAQDALRYLRLALLDS